MVANFRFFCFLTRIFPQNRQLRTPLRHRFQMSFRSLFLQRFNPLFAVCFFSFSSSEKPLSKNFCNACCITSVTPPFRDVFRPLFSLRNIAPKRCINMVLTVVWCVTILGIFTPLTSEKPRKTGILTPPVSHFFEKTFDKTRKMWYTIFELPEESGSSRKENNGFLGWEPKPERRRKRVLFAPVFTVKTEKNRTVFCSRFFRVSKYRGYRYLQEDNFLCGRPEAFFPSFLR